MTFAIRENVRLAEFTTLKIGGAARFFAEAASEKAISEATAFAEENDLALFVLGGGSNVLIADRGFDGLVLQIAVKGVSVSREKGDAVYISSGAGEDWDKLVAFCIAENLQGFECLSGIPGFVGGTPVQNVGAYGQEISETIASVRCFDRRRKIFVDLLNRQCKFAYRTSIFNTSEKNRYIVAGVTFALQKNGLPKIEYRDLQSFFGDKQPSLAEARKAILKIRAAKSMVIDSRDPNSKSAGSFFKNPIVSRNKFAEIEQIAARMGIGAVPSFAVDLENVKIPAAWLIEKTGFYKGYRKGNAGISNNHTLALVNLGAATAREIIALKEEIQTKVENIFDAVLEPEPVFIGFEK